MKDKESSIHENQFLKPKGKLYDEKTNPTIAIDRKIILGETWAFYDMTETPLESNH